MVYKKSDTAIIRDTEEVQNLIKKHKHFLSLEHIQTAKQNLESSVLYIIK
jgi:hypothetical protein